MAINFASPAINILSFLLFFIIVLMSFNNKNISKNNEIFIYGLVFIIGLISLYALFSVEQFVSRSLEYLIKAYLYLFTAILVFYSFSYKEHKIYIDFILIYSFIITILNIIGTIDYEGTSTNYLVYSLLLGVSIIILWFDILFKDISKLKTYFFIGLSIYFLMMNLMAGSRGTFIFTLLIVFIMFLIKLKSTKWYISLAYMTILVIVVFIGTISILEYIDINAWFMFKMERLFTGDMTEEPRYELYSNAFTYLKDNANLLGFGFHASRNVSTSWDPALPYLESFPFEMIFNYGIFGVFIVLFIVLFIIYFLNINKYKYQETSKSFFVFLYVFLNFSKSWSLYNGFVIFPLMSIILILYLNEKRILNK